MCLLLAQMMGQVGDSVLQPPQWGACAQFPVGAYEWTTAGIVWIAWSTTHACMPALRTFSRFVSW
ncbi:MAG: hypothetical protein PVH92_03600 [Anaerolineales bacterium]